MTKLTRSTPSIALILFCLALSSSCGKSRDADSKSTPVLSGPANTTFPMPPARATAMGELGWIAFDQQANQTQSQTLSRGKIADYKGKVLVLDFYATWCEPCRVSIPRLIDLQRRYQARGLVVVGLNVGGPDDRVKVPAFAKEFGIQYSLGFPDQNLSDFLLSDDSSIPQTFVFNRDGIPVKRFIGYQEATTGRLLEQLIEGETAKTAE